MIYCSAVIPTLVGQQKAGSSAARAVGWKRRSRFSRPFQADFGLLHMDGHPMSNGEIELTVPLATGADGQVNSGR